MNSSAEQKKVEGNKTHKQVFSFINKKTKELEQIRNAIEIRRREEAKLIVAPKPFDQGI